MKTLRCPNSKCCNYVDTEGFRPIDFECDNCGLEGHWFKEGYSYAARGYVRWKITGAAIDFVEAHVVDNFLFFETEEDDEKDYNMLLMAAKREAVEELRQDVAQHQKDLPVD